MGRVEDNLTALKFSSDRDGGGDQETAHVRKPGGLVIEAILGNGHLLHGSGRNVHGEESAEILERGLDDGNDDGFAIGGPRKGQIIGMKLLVMEKIGFECAIAPSNLEVSHRRIAM